MHEAQTPAATENSPAQNTPARGATALRLGLTLLCVLTALGMAGFAWLLLGYAKRPGPGAGPALALDPPADLGLEGISEALAEAEIIRDPWAFRWVLRLLDAETNLRTTRTIIRPEHGLDEMLPLLVQRGHPVLQLTFPEGFTRFDFARRLADYGIASEQAFLRAMREREALVGLQGQADSAEGYLFPDTYELRVPSAAGKLVRRLVDTFEVRIAPLLKAHPEALDTLKKDLGFTVHDVLTLASVVEKEAQLPRERPVIAGVFLNRLRDPTFRPHRLQADPTVSYGCLIAPQAAPSCAEFDGKRVTPAMVRDAANPYNTYRHDGLPPGPICNPGVDSVRAVLKAAAHDYYYFVANGDGSHRFSRTLEEHNQAIDATR